ncbi:MAG TPA: zinc ribbon domain-containing protein [Verrucomicrobiae bacterium]|nr:zinc ribbon domain-containing protein [Verrucomicrobiae bacterium]
MPIYEFHCEKCGRDSEIIVRSSDWKGTRCPQCGSAKLEKKFSVFASANGGSGDGASCESGGGGGGGGCCACASGRPHKH